MEDNLKLNVAIIGVGYWGPNFVRNLIEIDNIGKISVCDLNTERLSNIKKKFPFVETVSNLGAILDNNDIKAVFVITPVNAHFSVAEKCLLAGKNVFVEKPLARSSEECKKLIQIAEEKNKVLMVGHIMEYKPEIRKIRDFISKNELGDILYLDATRLNLGLIRSDVSVLWDSAVHDIYTLNFILGKYPKRISAVGEKFSDYTKVNLECVGFLSLDYGDGILAHVHINWISPLKVRKMMVCGTKKMLTYDDINLIEPLKVYDKGVEDDLSYRSGDTLIPRVENKEPLRAECEHFIDCVLDNKKPQSDGVSGLATVKIIEAAEESMRSQSKFIDINYDNGTI